MDNVCEGVFLHVRNGVLDAIDVAHDVDTPDLVPLLSCWEEVTVGTTASFTKDMAVCENGCVVDEDVDSAEGFEGVIHQVFYAFLAPRIRILKFYILCPAGLSQFFNRFLAHLLLDISDNDFCSFLCESSDSCFSYATCSSVTVPNGTRLSKTDPNLPE